MRPHVRDFRDYYRSTQGRLTRRAVNIRLQQAVGRVDGERVLTIGFGTPYMRDFMTHAETVLAVMSGRSGAEVWPADGPCCVTIADEAELPFRDQSFDCVILVHSLEWSETPHVMMREIWRILADYGRVVVVVPNRRSLWARLDTTPFGYGRPYSRSQLRRLLGEAMFTTTWMGGALLVPPGRGRVWFTLGKIVEEVFGRWLTRVSALTMATAKKNVCGVTPVGSRASKVSLVEVLSNGSSRQRGAHSRHSIPKTKGGQASALASTRRGTGKITS